MTLDRGLSAAIADALATHADKAAMTHGEERLSYRDLRRAMDDLAASARLTPSDVVAVRANGDLPTRVAVLACFRAGATVVPLSPRWPAERTRWIVNSTGCTKVLASDGRPRVREPDGPRGTRSARVMPAAYVLHTSGSTGVPKGVPVSEANLLHYLTNALAMGDYSPADRHSATFELSFDLAMHDLLVPLLTGGSSHLPIQREYLMPAGYMGRCSLTRWFSVPSVVSTAAALNGLRTPVPDAPHALFCGEALTWIQARLWADFAPGGRMENWYGPTELTLACTRYELPHRSGWPETSNDTVPIGTAFPGMRCRIGSDRSPQELLVTGPQMVRGYLDPAHDGAFETRDGERWYRTGDAVTQEAGGLLVHQGRIDRQVQIGGMRIELGEIETALRRCARVREACAVAIPGAITTIGAAVCGDGVDQREVARELRKRLPEYMLPATLVVLPEMPLNNNGKIDRRRALEEVTST